MENYSRNLIVILSKAKNLSRMRDLTFVRDPSTPLRYVQDD